MNEDTNLQKFLNVNENMLRLADNEAEGEAYLNAICILDQILKDISLLG